MRLALVVLVASVWLRAPALMAQDESVQASRRLLLERAQAARAANDHAHALEFATAAGRIEMSVSLRLFIAEEQVATGAVAPALGNADVCVREAERNAALANRDAILSRCRELTVQLRSRVAMLVVRVTEPAPPGLHVTVAGVPLTEALFGLPSVVTPGNVVVDASSADGASFHHVVTVEAGATAEVVVALAPPAQGSHASSTRTASPGPTAAGNPGGTAASSGPGIAPIAPIVVAGVGALGLIGGAVFFALRQGALGSCAQSGMTLLCSRAANDSAVTWNTATNVALVVGGVALAAGAAWWIIARLTSHTDARATVAVIPTEHGMFVGIGGSL